MILKGSYRYRLLSNIRCHGLFCYNFSFHFGWDLNVARAHRCSFARSEHIISN
jgi:hypothetical protein